MARRRQICTFAYALQLPTVSDAVYQRGAYFVRKMNDRPKDYYKYAVFIGSEDVSDFLCATGQITKAKTIVNQLYKAFPSQTKVSPDLKPILERLKRKYGIKLRPDYERRQRRMGSRAYVKFGKGKERGISLEQELKNRLESIRGRVGPESSLRDIRRARRLAEDVLNTLEANSELVQDLGERLQLEVETEEVILKLNEQLEAKRRKTTARKKKGTLTAQQVQDLLRAGITCERDPSEVVAELAKAPQRPNVKEAIAILKGTRCRKEANKEAQAQRAQRPIEQELLTRAKAKEILDSFQSVKISEHIQFANFTKDRVKQAFKDGRNRRTLLKQLDKLIENRNNGIIPDYGIRRVL